MVVTYPDGLPAREQSPIQIVIRAQCRFTIYVDGGQRAIRRYRVLDVNSFHVKCEQNVDDPYVQLSTVGLYSLCFKQHTLSIHPCLFAPSKII